MTKKTHGLGRGLEALFQDAEDWGVSVQNIRIGDLDPNPDQPRKVFPEESIAQLAQSILDQGVLQPLLVCPRDGGRYRIIAGERRFRACRKAGLDEVPCIVRDLDAVQQMEVALIENLQREDLNPCDEALGISALMRQCGYTQEKAAERLGKSRPAIANLLRLLTLPDQVFGMVRDGTLSAGHARVLAGLKDEDDKLRLAEKTVAEGLSVRQLEELAAGIREKKKPERKEKTLSSEMSGLCDRIRETLGFRTTMKGSESKGRIILSYSSRDELDRLCEILDRLEK